MLDRALPKTGLLTTIPFSPLNSSRWQNADPDEMQHYILSGDSLFAKVPA